MQSHVKDVSSATNELWVTDNMYNADASEKDCFCEGKGRYNRCIIGFGSDRVASIAEIQHKKKQHTISTF